MSNEIMPPNAAGYYRITLRGEEGDYPSLIDVTTFLYDFNLLYEFTRLVVDPEYSDYSITHVASNRNRTRILAKDQLDIESLRIQSPIALVLVVLAKSASVALTLLTLAKAVEKIWNIPVNHEIQELTRDNLMLEREKRARELQAPQQTAPIASVETENAFRQQLQSRNADSHFDRAENRLSGGPIRIKEFEVTYVREPPVRDRSNTNVRS
jgi:hypothetical protein